MSKHAKKRDGAKLKIAEARALRSFYNIKPKWGFSMSDYWHDRWGVATNADSLSDALQYLGGLERVSPSETWRDVLAITSGRKNNTRHHFIQTSKICREAQRRLAELNLEDCDKLLSIAANSELRVWGIVNEDGVCYILWLDPSHDVYPVE
jgi:hypothetical protein